MLEEVRDSSSTVDCLCMTTGERRKVAEAVHESLRPPSKDELNIGPGEAQGVKEHTSSDSKGMTAPPLQMLAVGSID